MEKKEQLLVITPQTELKFCGPFNQSITSYMNLKNPTDKTILFKIKTTAPKKYCVRPNCGTLQPKEMMDIAICLQPFNFDANEKNKHKFMVQSLVAPDGEINFEQMWKDVTPDQLMDSKLRCVFDLPADKTAPSSTNEHNEFTSTATSSLPASDEKIAETDSTSMAAAEINSLREKESNLRQENILLQEQVLRLRMSVESNTKESAAFQNPYSPPHHAQQTAPMVYVALAVVMAIFGLILGKFVL
ncbi:Vesicle-associated membrane protein/synaptobrevin-binding protein [Pseudolycoriella hygida]|uniref:Vesicle-associated membrane protein/synaptobrevin-binding protein n=1 Tax=Pseudolycoriella hygida TaxID=35572 RepID=A0A9Q0MXB0_9DIPT|nr:Vesicle-associated membrane protein/synaptobrevin-binding protein [Pseudolycoriella hygida]